LRLWSRGHGEGNCRATDVPAAAGGDAHVGTGDFETVADVLPEGGRRQAVVGRNTGTSFAFSVFGDLLCDETKETVGAADLDGDGRSDFYCISYHGRFFAQLSNGTSFVNGTFTGIGPGYCDFNAFQLMDLNADGAPDIVCPQNGNVALSTGRSFIDLEYFMDFRQISQKSHSPWARF
jgi:hypothetical protein